MAKPKLQRGSFNLNKSIGLSGLMECLVSAESQQNLFDRIDDEDEELADIGLNGDLANQGIDWWAENNDLLVEIIEMFSKSIEKVSVSMGFTIWDLLQSWSCNIWSDFIRETFDTVWNFGDESNFEYFFNYAVRQALGYNIEWSSTQDESDNAHANWSPEISGNEWDLMSKVFKAWWMGDEVFEIFSWVYEATKEGRAIFGIR